MAGYMCTADAVFDRLFCIAMKISQISDTVTHSFEHRGSTPSYQEQCINRATFIVWEATMLKMSNEIH